jgi:formate C-acetyltransferase
MQRLREEMTGYYAAFRLARGGRDWTEFPAESLQLRRAILAAMDAYAAAHPEEHPSLLKARLHEEMAECFEPVLFRFSPFFFEMGLRFSENWGCPYLPEITPGAWLFHRRHALQDAMPEMAHLRRFNMNASAESLGVWNIWGGFDNDHHCLGTTHLLAVGVEGVRAEIAARRAAPCTAEQAANLEAMDRSCRAVLRVAEKFRDRARAMLATETDPQAARHLAMIADAASHVPARPPRTFYEGLAMLWFLREVTATLEAIGVSVIGHLDRQLIGLYRADLAAGRLTEAEARDLLARWMLPTDIKFFVTDSQWPETSTCLELGGCDADGAPVWNELTRLCIEVHRDHRLINPKPNCRYTADAPQAYLDLISETTLGGHNHFALLNDDVLIPALVRAGKTEREARQYVNGGCQEPMVEGVEHSAGAYYYFNLARVFDLCLRPEQPAWLDAAERAVAPAGVEGANFDQYYAGFLDQFTTIFRAGATWATTMGREQWRVHPCPFLSATLDGCIASGTDYTRGGAKYNPGGVALVGLGTVVDALNALRVAVFEERWLTLDALRAALDANWAGHEELRARLRRLPHYGHNDPAVDALAARLAHDVAAIVRATPNERGGHFQSSFFVYYFFSHMARDVRATPDGRADGDLLTQGVAPDRTTAPTLVETFHSLSAIDFTEHPANAVLDVQLPAGANIPPVALSATLRTFAHLGGPTLQLNVVSVDELEDARRHPERHRDLVVRISGLSAHFVCLAPNVQQEIIDRAMMAV